MVDAYSRRECTVHSSGAGYPPGEADALVLASYSCCLPTGREPGEAGETPRRVPSVVPGQARKPGFDRRYLRTP